MYTAECRKNYLEEIECKTANLERVNGIEKRALEEGPRKQSTLSVKLQDGETMYLNVDADGWVEIRFSDNMKKTIKANADYFASFYR